MTPSDFSSYIKNADFINLFNECGWDAPRSSRPLAITLGDTNYNFIPVAQKCDFTIYTLTTPSIPDSSIRRTLDSRLSKLSLNNFIIYISASEPLHHLWSVPVRRVDRRHLVNVNYEDLPHAQFLLEKINDISFSISSSSPLTIIDVINRVNSAFLVNTEKITKDFYRDFQKHHTSFVKAIQNVSEPADREWFASVILNRLMFCYFLQKKGFLDQDFNYLSNHLASYQSKAQQKGDSFYKSFYRGFLVHLFGEGLNSPSSKRPKDFSPDFYGTIPYLNGGMFARHEIEDRNPNLDIPDSVFESLFKFFDTWHWHLDTSITSTGRDINPDVLGYIFEQYINDRAQMGAYYTKEDITEYIGRNCILPHLLETTRAQCPDPFKPKSGLIWQTLAKNPSAYIFPAAKQGLDSFNSLPPEIAQGLDPTKPNLKKRRADWNKPTPQPFALPTEIWRETISRLQRTQSLRDKIAAGQISSIQDFITYNLDIRSFTKDLLSNTTDHKFLLAFYHALQNITILDPTCGSGAFLFGALNILEPLYETCLDRMQELAAIDKQKNPKSKLFQKELEDFALRGKSNTKYFIYKSIILRNLYGVDIMHEATEIARLRLFLKMVAAVDVDPSSPNLGLDPLPDIDFNLRCGNTLVGYSSEDAIYTGLTNGDMFARAQLKDKIENGLPIIAETYKAFHELQLRETDPAKLKETKAELQRRLQDMRDTLNDQLYQSAAGKPDKSGKKKADWLKKVQPFHWYTEFYPIMHDHKGFDVIIGNPPYVVYTEAGCGYKIDSSYKTKECINLYAFCVERSQVLLNRNGCFGMIVPNSAVSADKMAPLRKVVTEKKSCWFSNYSWRPAKLFEGADMLLTIILNCPSSEQITFTTRYQKWYEEFRPCLFSTLRYNDITNAIRNAVVPKVADEYMLNILNKITPESSSHDLRRAFLPSKTKHVIYYFRAVQYWFKVLDFIPLFEEDGVPKVTTEMKPLWVDTEVKKLAICALLSSTTFFVNYILWSSCQVVNSRDLEISFAIDNIDSQLLNVLAELGKQLLTDYQKHSQIKIRNYSKKGREFVMKKQHFFIKHSKPIIDEIDELLAKHYGFTPEEIDFIINYDIKYRMGDELE